MLLRKILLLLFLGIYSNNLLALNDCSKCATELLSQEELKLLSKDDLTLLRNEIWARAGYKFHNKKVLYYFLKQDWYHYNHSNLSVELTPIAAKNVALIKRLENKLDYQFEYYLKTQGSFISNTKEAKALLRQLYQSLLNGNEIKTKLIDEQGKELSISMDLAKISQQILEQLQHHNFNKLKKIEDGRYELLNYNKTGIYQKIYLDKHGLIRIANYAIDIENKKFIFTDYYFKKFNNELILVHIYKNN